MSATAVAEAPDVPPTDAQENPRQQTIRTAIIAVTALFISVILHEYSHAVAQLSYGAGARVRAIDSSPLRELPAAQGAVTAITGPVFSLVLGLIVYFATRGLRQGYLRTLSTWLGLASMMNFFGYLIIAPVPNTDTNVFITGVGLPSWIAFLMIPGGIAGMIWLSMLLGKEVGDHSDGLVHRRAATYYPWLVATAILAVCYTVFALIIHYPVGLLFLVILGPVTGIIFAPMATPRAMKRSYSGVPLRTGNLPVCLVVGLVMLAVAAFHAVVGVTLH